MVYRRFGCVYSRLLLSKQDEMSRLEAMLLAMDRTDQAENNGHYLMSMSLDVEREQVPEAWDGQSRVQLLGKLEKLALEYGKYPQPRHNTTPPMCPRVFRGSFRYCRSTTPGPHLLRLRARGERAGNGRPA